MPHESIWNRSRAAATTGRPPRHGRTEIVSAAIRLAEDDGLAAVTMRRVAAQLGTGAASLYRHLDTRDDLLDLMIDHVLQSYRPPPRTGDPYDDVVADLLQRLQLIRAHAWLCDALEDRPTLSPERIRLIELSLERLTGHPAPGPTKIEALTVLGGMLTVQARHERADQALDPEVAQAQIELLQRAAADGNHPHLTTALAEPPPAASETSDERFARVLRLTLLGLLPSTKANTSCAPDG
jgi:AcrR family transcriptional regulator